MAIDLDTLIGDFKEPRLLYQWEVILPTIQGVGGTMASFAQEVELPHGRIDYNPYHRHNTKRYDPGFADVDALSITFAENTYGEVVNYLQLWKLLVADEDGFYGAPEEYKQEVEVYMLDPKGERLGGHYVCEGIWPSQVAPFSFGHDSALLQPVCTFSCDNVQVIRSGGGSRAPALASAAAIVPRVLGSRTAIG